jgi:hypothetical protein
MTEAIQAAQRHYAGSDDLDVLFTKLEKFLDTIEPPLKAENLCTFGATFIDFRDRISGGKRGLETRFDLISY